MGVVFKAFDTRLERMVALKLLRHDAFEGGHDNAEAARLRLVREAQALAQISHENVLTVFDAGTLDEEVYVAMELVEGQTFKTWLAQSHPWREIVAKFVQAGSGLMAAHAQGVVHRDFKPENVLLARDGRVRVADFGLVGVGAQHAAADKDAGTDVGRALDLTLIRAGVSLGTPLYMSPEQHAGEMAGAAGDQFAFCVALYRALYGQAPFAGETLVELRSSVLEGRPRDPPRSSPVRARVQRAIMRGLARQPNDRHPSMQALLSVLHAEVESVRRRTLGLLAVALVGVGVGAAVVTKQVRSRSQMCSGGAPRMEAVWTPDIAGRVHAAFARTGHPGADSIAGRLDGVIDGFRRRWIEVYTETCEATAVRKQQSAELLDRKMACLQARRGSAAAMVKLYLTADRELVSRAIETSPRASELDGCRDDTALLAAYPLPSKELAPAVAEVSAELDHVDALGKAGRQALTAAQTAVDKARRLGYPPLVARALHRLAETQSQTDAQRSEPLFGEAEQAAARASDDRMMALVLARHIHVLATKLGRTEAALALRPAAEAAAIRSPQDPLVEADVANSLGQIFMATGDYQHWLPQTERVLALRRAALGDDHPDVARALHNMGIAMLTLRRLAEARQVFESLLATRKRMFGTEDHVDVARTVTSLGDVSLSQGRYAEARTYYERALGIYDRVFGPGSPEVAVVQMNVGVTLALQCQYAESLRWYQNVLTVLDRQRGRQNLESLTALDDLGISQLQLGAYARAEQMFREALARKTAGAGTEGMHPELVNALTGLADVALARGRPAEALPYARDAVAFAERRLPEDHLDRAKAVSVLGEALLALGRAKESLPLLERALAGHEQSKVPVNPSRADTQFALAEALWRTGGDRKRAIELAHVAQHMVTSTCPRPRLAGEIARWLQRTATQ
jgi:serine/threonine-protein kinase